MPADKPSTPTKEAIDADVGGAGVIAKRAPQRLSRTAINFALDFALLVAFLGLIWNTAVLRFVFPPGTAADGWKLWSFGYDDWAGFQFALICVLLLGVLLHVMLHWTWICGVIAARWPWRRAKQAPRPDEGAQTLYGVGLIIVIVNIVGLMLAAAALSIRAP